MTKPQGPLVAREADKRHSDIQAEAEQREAEVRAGVAGDNLQAALRPTSVLPARRQQATTRVILTDEQMRELGRDLFAKPEKETENE